MARNGGDGKYGKFGKKGKQRQGRRLFFGRRVTDCVAHLPVLPLIYHPCQIYHSNHSSPRFGEKERDRITCKYFESLCISSISQLFLAIFTKFAERVGLDWQRWSCKLVRNAFLPRGSAEPGRLAAVAGDQGGAA
jgi:hypothetical protein